METAFQRNKTNFITTLDEESNALHNFLREELRRRKYLTTSISVTTGWAIIDVNAGEDGFARERKSYLDEIEMLRLRLSSVERLERENQSLLEKQQSLSLQLENSEIDYRRLAEARQCLEDKLRKSFDYNRRWNEFYQAMMRGTIGSEYPSSLEKLADTDPRLSEGSRLARNLPPQPLHPVNSSILVSRSTQQEEAPPINYLTSYPQLWDSENRNSREDRLKGLETDPSSARPEDLNHRLEIAPKILGLIPITNEVNTDPGDLPIRKNSQHEVAADGLDLPENRSDGPILVSERSLGKKSTRKRKAEDSICAYLGSAHTPIKVKSETGSSSPLIMSKIDRTCDPDDCLDLDEIEDSHYTPRKRRQIAEQRLHSSLNRAVRMESDDERLLSDLKIKMFGTDNVEDEHRNLEREEDCRGSDSSVFVRAGEDVETTGTPGLSKDAATTSTAASPSKIKPSSKVSIHAVQQMYNTRARRSLGSNADVGGVEFRSPGGIVTSSRLDNDTPSGSCSSQHGLLSCSLVMQSGSTSHLKTPPKATGNKQPVVDNSILRVADPNTRILPRTNKSPTPLRQCDRGVAFIPLVAEDGEEVHQVTKCQKRVLSSSITPVSKGAQKIHKSHLRLGNLLNEAPTPRAPLDPPKVNPGTTNTRHRSAKDAGISLDNETSCGWNQRSIHEACSPKSSTRSKPVENIPCDRSPRPASPLRSVTWFQKLKNSSEAKSLGCTASPENRAPKAGNQTRAERSTAYTSSGRKTKNSQQTYSEKATAPKFTTRPVFTADDTSEILAEPEPLRVRPLHRLHIDDFKINPNYNSGYDFAFKETVRKRDLGQCLPGCMKPTCCGSAFLQMVKLGGFPIPSSLSESESASETQLLTTYLGSDSVKLRHMTSAEKRELLIQAKARQLADHYGKHRQAYERRTSPPGFWDVDFPSTQEGEAYREKAREMEREKVRERYREAMREGGAWLFRDEYRTE